MALHDERGDHENLHQKARVTARAANRERLIFTRLKSTALDQTLDGSLTVARDLSHPGKPESPASHL
jgi:hypothetical protein